MATLVRRRPGPFIRLGLIPLLVLTVRGQERPAEPAPPAPTPAVQQRLTEAGALDAADAGKILEVAERALVLARQVADAPGEAQAQQLRASQLTKLGRDSDALAAWRDADMTWIRVGDGPGRVEALGFQAALMSTTDAQQRPELLRQAISLAEAETKRPQAAAAALAAAGAALMDRSLFGDARRTYQAAATISERTAPDSLGLARILHACGNAASSAGDLRAARDYYLKALAIREKLVPDSMDVAAVLQSLGNTARNQSDLSSAADYYQRALAIRTRLAPNSLLAASTINSLGIVAFGQGDLTTAGKYYGQALEIREKLAPNSMEVASSLGNLSNVANERGDLTVAREYGERARALFAKVAPDSLAAAFQLGDLANVISYQGDLNTARSYRERALALIEKLSPNSSDAAIELNNLGMDAREMGDIAAAREYHERALRIRQALSPESLSVSSSLKNLGVVAFEEGNLTAAREYEERALRIRERLSPNTLMVADVLNNLGAIAQAQGDLPAAADYQSRALVIGEKQAPNSIYVSESLKNLGALATERGDLKAARDYSERALATAERLAPNSLAMADTLSSLGRLAAAEGNLSLGVQQGVRAFEIIRQWSASVAGDEARQGFETRFLGIGRQLARSQVAIGQTDAAFVTVEEGRAQALLQVLAERGLVRRLAPPEVWRIYEVAVAASNRAEEALETAGAAEATAALALATEVAQKSAESVVQEKRGIANQRAQTTEAARQAYTRARLETEARWNDVRQSIRSAMPAVSATASRSALPLDALLLAFVIGDDGSALFMVQRDGPVRAVPLALPLKELTARVNVVRDSVSRESGRRGIGINVADTDEVRIRAARDLYQKLFPAEARAAIEAAGRVILSPDGALWDLPFAALVMNEQGKPQYLGLEKPLVYAQSLTTFAQARQTSAAPRAAKPNVLVVGNPLFDNARRNLRLPRPAAAASLTTKRGDGELALLSRDGAIPEPLPFAEEEAAAVARIYGVRAAVGAEPTEAWFRTQAPQADIIHLATHGFFNPFRAVSSGVRLAVPQQPPAAGDTNTDGALQAWEVFNMQLRADLIVLSACETGLGSKVPGEGLVGLTRAFQVAGAASIIATEWRVSDRSTAAGMVALHQNLRKGLTKDEALRQTMRKLAGDPATADPYYWAPFVLVGDFQPLRTMSR